MYEKLISLNTHHPKVNLLVYLLLLKKVYGFADILYLVDPEPPSSDGADLFSGESLKKTNQEPSITEVSVKVVNVVTSLQKYYEGCIIGK